MYMPKINTLILNIWPQITIFSKTSAILIANNWLKIMLDKSFLQEYSRGLYLYNLKKCEAGYSHSDLIDKNIDFVNILIIYQ